MYVRYCTCSVITYILMCVWICEKYVYRIQMKLSAYEKWVIVNLVPAIKRNCNKMLLSKIGSVAGCGSTGANHLLCIIKTGSKYC